LGISNVKTLRRRGGEGGKKESSTVSARGTKKKKRKKENPNMGKLNLSGRKGERESGEGTKFYAKSNRGKRGRKKKMPRSM